MQLLLALPSLPITTANKKQRFELYLINDSLMESSLVSTLPITKKNKHTVVAEAHKEYTCAVYALLSYRHN